MSFGKSTFYRHLHKVADVPITCPQCGVSMTVDMFYRKHASEHHHLNARTHCVFCFGKTQRCGKHIIQCLKQFVQDAKEEPMEEATEEIPEEICPCHTFVSKPREMWSRPKERLSEYVGWYESCFEKPEMWTSEVVFTEASGLGSDVYGMVQRYLQQDMQWFHILVKHDAFDTFRREMKAIEEEIVVLPFWCLCDGGASEHRHMLLACVEESHFQDVWREKVRYDFPHHGPAKKCVRIRNAFHLVRTIQYVSQPKALCDGRIPEHWTEAERLSHFHLNRPLHPHAIAVLCTLFPGGVDYLLREQLSNQNVVEWELVTKKEGRWRVPIHVTHWKFLQCQIPVVEKGGQALWLGQTKTVEDDPSFQPLRNDWYVLSKKQQNVMNQLEISKKRVKQEEKARWQAKFTQVWKQWEKEREETEKAFQMENNELKKEKEYVNKKMERLEREIVQVQKERDALQIKEKEWKSKEQEFKMIITNMKLDQLLAENDKLKRKLQILME